MKSQQLILLEFNELCPALLKQWMGEGRLPNFKKFYEASQVFTACADDDNPDHWEPWIQWYSIHTGLSYSQHGVFHLSDGPAAPHDDVWQMLARNGHAVANCGSMNAKAIRRTNCFYIPDPWCRTEPSHPPELSTYSDIVAGLVHDSSRHAATLPKRAYVKFLKFMLGHGLGFTTIRAILRQLWSDTILHQQTAWKRVVILDKLQFDVFSHYWRNTQPSFSTFFLNSTAHYQHAYWHLLFPESFQRPIQVNTPEGAEEAILFGYQQMDALLARFFEFEKLGALLMLCTALSQQANSQAGKFFYRPRDAKAFLNSLSIECQELLPVMAHQYSARFKDGSLAEEARRKLMALRYQGQPVIDLGKDSPADTVFFGVRPVEGMSPEARIEAGNGITFRFADWFYLLPTVKSGAHHSDSVLWIKTGNHRVHSNPVSILDILPTVLDHYGMDARGFGSPGTRSGRSLWPLMRSPLKREELEIAVGAKST